MERQWLLPIGVVLLSVGVGFLLRVVIVWRLAALFSRTATDLDDLVLAATRRHLPFWVLLLGLAIASRIAPFPGKGVQIIDRFCMVGLVISLSLAMADLLIGIVGRRTRS